MDLIKQIIPVMLTLSLAGLVVTVGLRARLGDLVYVVSRPVLLGKALLAVHVIPLAAGILFALMLPLAPVVKAGIVLMALSPVPPLVPGKELDVGGRREYAYGLYVILALLSVIVVPVGLEIATRVFGRDDGLSVAVMARTVLTGVIIPLAIGVAVRRLNLELARRIAPWIYRLSMALVTLAFVPILAAAWPAIVDLVGDGALAAMAAVVLISIAGGHLLGGPQQTDRADLAIAASVRHPGIAMLIANTNTDDKRVTAAILLFLLVGLVAGLPYQQWVKRRARRAAAEPGFQAASPGSPD